MSYIVAQYTSLVPFSLVVNGCYAVLWNFFYRVTVKKCIRLQSDSNCKLPKMRDRVLRKARF